ncbi:MAG: endoglucanase [Muribaculaceae bacterium]|nr:endoglucanase [Muribaculaceae bacterium]
MKLGFILTIGLLAASLNVVAAPRGNAYKAADSTAVRYVGRTQVLPDDGGVKFDWSGVYAETRLEGRELKLRLSDTKRSYFDVSVDGKPAGKFRAEGRDTLVTVAEGLTNGVHDILIRKRTEGETGTTTFQEFVLPRGGKMTATQPRTRFIEIIGNSLSAGFGTEGKDRSEPFTPENENCNLAYSTIIPRYFDADYAIIAHSGRGAVRNYGDSVRVSAVAMRHKFHQALDEDTLSRWDFAAYRPDLVIVNLGANDFSTEPHPYRSEFVDGYVELLQTLFEKYGADLKVMCVIPYAVSTDQDSYYHEAIAKVGSPNVYLMRMPVDYINSTTDRGAVWHPNYNGQRKMAMLLIPYISTIMDWPLTGAPVE